MDMLINPTVVELSRLQFALTALYHFLFVPLTLGMTFILATMETVYVITGKPIYKEMTQFWGKLFGINFAWVLLWSALYSLRAISANCRRDSSTTVGLINMSMNFLLQRSRNVPTGHVMVHIFFLCHNFVYIIYTSYFY